jgi:hypothetical protein
VTEARKFLSIRTLRGRTIASDPDALELKRQKLSLDVDRARAELAITKNEWVEKRVVQGEWQRALLRVKNRFLGLGRELAPLLHGRGPIETGAERVDRRTWVADTLTYDHSHDR